MENQFLFDIFQRVNIRRLEMFCKQCFVSDNKV